MRTQRGDSCKEDKIHTGLMSTERGDTCKEDKIHARVMRTQRGDNCNKITSLFTTMVKDLVGERWLSPSHYGIFLVLTQTTLCPHCSSTMLNIMS